MYDLDNTSSFIRSRLDELNIPYKYPYAKTGIVATIGKGSNVVGLRSDMDALPIEEHSDVPFRSKLKGKMHACGHDAHMTMLLGGAKLLKQHEDELQGTVKLFFQPAEEGGAGGDRMVKEGATKGVKAMFGQHVWPTLALGHIGSRPGAFLAGAQEFHVVIKGKGMHAAMPHLGRDPIAAAAHIISALQLLVSRETPPVGSAVISVTMIHAGEGAYNVVPDTASFGGTIRSLSLEGMKVLKKRFAEVVEHQAAALECTSSIDWMDKDSPAYPPTINDPEAVKFAMGVSKKLLGSDKVNADHEPTMGGEDFAFYGLSGIPSTFMFLGTQNEKIGAVHSLHSPRFKLDESILPTGAALHAALAFEYLNNRDSAKKAGSDEL
ncbi:hypothetical protein WJX73_003962 [Symbiochloris irregularis]|uniref:Peptidase M20 dimerisation domain-containing protein n=1 Tax=Symbiochloris irregularis TaxID=706552 RepID=A0AAW1NJ31_9CHLO